MLVNIGIISKKCAVVAGSTPAASTRIVLFESVEKWLNGRHEKG